MCLVTLRPSVLLRKLILKITRLFMMIYKLWEQKWQQFRRKKYSTTWRKRKERVSNIYEVFAYKVISLYFWWIINLMRKAINFIYSNKIYTELLCTQVSYYFMFSRFIILLLKKKGFSENNFEFQVHLDRRLVGLYFRSL